LFGPQATLYPGNVPFPIATHFLSPNPEEFGTPRPTWQHAHDGSAVRARAIQPSTDANYVAPGAIRGCYSKRPAPPRDRSAARRWRRRRSFIASTPKAASRRQPAHDGGPARRDRASAVSTDYFFYRKEK
jgi:hypothetical protein